MGIVKQVYQRLGRPQTMAGAIGGLLVVAGCLLSPQIVHPTHATGQPIIRPLQPVVLSASTVTALTTTAVDCAKVPCLALTFDDGPSATVTPRVLDILDRHNAKATFFLIGLHVADNHALVRRIYQSGHEIGNHTWSHSNLAELSPEQVEQEVQHCQEAIAAAGVPLPRLFRAPFGAVGPMVRSHVPLTVVSWNVDPEDWRAKKPEAVIAHVLANAKPGAIVDLHDIYPATADALDPLLSNLEQNYHLVTVSDLLSLPPGQPGIFYGR